MNLTTLATYLGPASGRAADRQPLRVTFAAGSETGEDEPIRLEALAWDQTADRLRALNLEVGERVEISGTFYAYPESRGPKHEALRLQITLRSVGRVDRPAAERPASEPGAN